MEFRTIIASGFCAAALSACATQAPGAQPVKTADPNSSLEPCIAQAMEFMVGTWDYTGVVARISGPSRTFVTRSKHWNTDMENTWSGQAFGGDITEEEPISFDRVRGNMIFGVEDGVEQLDDAQIVFTCEGPDNVGRITMTSTYQLPLDEEETEFLTVDRLSTYTKDGTYSHEYLKDADGKTVAYRADVTVPAEDG